jgi:hypothetical protein
MSTRSPLSSTIRSSLLSALYHNEEDCLTMQHGRASRNAGHRGRRNAEPFAAYDEDATAAPSFTAVSSTLLPSLADRVRVPQGEQRWLRFDSRGSASYIDKIDKQALVTSLQLPARDLVMVRFWGYFFLLLLRVFFKTEKKTHLVSTLPLPNRSTPSCPPLSRPPSSSASTR